MSVISFFSSPKRPVFGIALFLGSLYCCTTPVDKHTNAADQAAPIPSYEEVVASNAAVRLNQEGDSVLALGDYPSAIACYQLSMDSAAANADSFPYYDSKLDLACVHDRLGELNKAIEIAEPVVEAFIRSEDSSRIGRGYATLAGFYGKANMPEKSMAATLKGFEIVKNYGSLMERCAAYNQMAFTFSDQQRWSEALPYLDTALTLMKMSEVLDQLPSMYLNLGDCHRNLKNYPQARFYLQQTADMADSLGQVHVLSRAIERLSQIAEASGDPKTALALFKKSKIIRDSILNQEKIARLQALEVAYNTREKEFQIQALQLEHQASLARRNLMYALSAFLLVGLGLGFFQARAKLKATRKSLAINQAEVKAFAKLLLAKNTQILELETVMMNLQSHPPGASSIAADEKNTEPIAGAEDHESLYNSRILTFEDWESFKRRFEQAYPGYLIQLRATYSELSGAEERLYLLIKLGFNTQEIANTLGISANGVKKGRQRLRKRLNLRPEDDLDLSISGHHWG